MNWGQLISSGGDPMMWHGVFRTKRVLSTLLLVLSAGLNIARCQPHMELVLEQSPAQAGTMTPRSGTHTYATHSQIFLTAEPQAGYRFSHWLGDVSDPQSSTTQVHLDSSKVVVAVYDPIDAEDDYEEEALVRGGGGGSSQLLPTAATFFSNSFSAPGGSRPQPEPFIHVVPTSPVPEPATFLLLGLGTLTLSRRRRVWAG